MSIGLDVSIRLNVLIRSGVSIRSDVPVRFDEYNRSSESVLGKSLSGTMSHSNQHSSISV